MSIPEGLSGPEFAHRPQEQEAVRTTIVGGVRPAVGNRWGRLGHRGAAQEGGRRSGLQVAVAPHSAAAADMLGLRLEPAEALMLAAAPADQLEAVIARTTVPQEHRRVFLGQAAAAMLAAVGVATASCGPPPVGGSRPGSVPPAARRRSPGHPAAPANPAEPPSRQIAARRSPTGLAAAEGDVGRLD